MSEESRSSHRDSQATKLVSIAESGQLFHSPDSTAFASVPVETHIETWPVRSRAFKQFLSREFYKAEKTAPRAQSLQEALGVITAKACFDGREDAVFLRVAERDGSLWIDLGNRSWQAVEVTIYGWRITDNPPIRFRRSPGMLPLPAPIRGGKIEELGRYLNLSSEADRVLVYSWLVAALRPRGPYPILNLLGEQGTAKSTAARVLRALVDPFAAPLRTPPRDERDLQISAKNSHVIALDNISRLEPWLSDALCRVATGGGLAIRELYSDTEETIFDAQRPVLLNGIEDVATRGDFIERCIMVYLAPIKETQRVEEARFWSTFEIVKPRIFGAILNAMVSALDRIESVHLPRLPRMADFARWAVSAEQGLGFRAGTFLNAYDRNRSNANVLALEASPVVNPIIDLIAEQAEWEGTASDLLAELRLRSSEELTRTRLWPSSARSLSGILRRLAPNFRGIGIAVSFPPRQAGTGRRLIALEKVAATSSQPSQSPGTEPFPTLPNEALSDDCDGCDGELQSDATLEDVRVAATATKEDGLR
jgi:hypothetical protein